jgi:hypothetical protein
MSYTPPGYRQRITSIGPSHADEIAEKSVHRLAALPIDPRVAELADAGAMNRRMLHLCEIVGGLTSQNVIPMPRRSAQTQHSCHCLVCLERSKNHKRAITR